MTTATEEIRTALVTFPGLQALVGNGDSPETYRVYSQLMPQDSAMPTIVMSKQSQIRENLLDDNGTDGVDNQRCRFNIYAKTLAECETVKTQISLALAAHDNTNFKAVEVFQLDLYEDDTHLYRVSIDFSIWYRH